MAAQDVNVLTPNLNQGRDPIVPPQNGTTKVVDVHLKEHEDALKKHPVEDANWAYKPEDANPQYAARPSATNLIPDTDFEKQMASIWNPQATPAGNAQIAHGLNHIVPAAKDTHTGTPEAPDWGYTPRDANPAYAQKQLQQMPPKDDVEGNMAKIWNPYYPPAVIWTDATTPAKPKP
ncbi:hypothetical protein EX011_21300 [Salmonella enterica]|nr:hypothetical protein [Salmonella enterica]EBL7042062.1 hypothetical protein [Salmonella enterica]